MVPKWSPSAPVPIPTVFASSQTDPPSPPPAKMPTRSRRTQTDLDKQPPPEETPYNPPPSPLLTPRSRRSKFMAESNKLDRYADAAAGEKLPHPIKGAAEPSSPLRWSAAMEAER